MTARPSLLDYQIAQAPTQPLPVAPVKKATKAKAQTEELIQTSFRLPRSRWKKLQELSIDQRRSVQSILIKALETEFANLGLKF